MPSLVSPIVPSGTESTDNYLKGFSLMAGLAQRRRQTELTIQQMHLDEKFKNEQFRQNQEKIDQDAALLPSQIAGAESMAKYHNAVAKAYSEGVGNAAQRKQTLLKDVGNFAKDVGEIQSPVGTTAFQHELDLTANKYPDIQGTPEFARVYNGKLLEHSRAATQNRVTQNSILSNYRKFLSENNVSPYAFENPDMWKSNKDGKTKFLLVDKTGAIHSPDTDTTKDPTNASGFRYITIPNKKWDILNQQHKAINDIYENMLYAPSPEDTARPARETSQIPVVQSDDDFNALESGDVFVGPDGKTRRKP